MTTENRHQTEADREFYELSTPEAVTKYFKDGVYKVAQGLARNGIIPPPDIISLGPKVLSTDENVANMLAEVQVVDPHFKNIDLSTDEGKLDATILSTAKSIAVTEQNPRLAKGLRKIEDKVISGMVDFFTGPLNPSRRGFLRKVTIIALGLAAAACGPQVVGPIIAVPDGGLTRSPATETAGVPTQTETPTPTPTETATPTPTETPTPEVKQFPICQIENFRDCPITVDDLFNGNYLRWLNTLSKPFDQSKIKQVPMEVMHGGLIVYDTKTAPNFTDPATAPFRRDVTAGYTSYQGIDYIVMPVEYFDPKHPDKNPWVITVKSEYWPGHNQDKANKELPPLDISTWKKSMKITVIVNNNDNLAEYGKSVEDPLAKMTFDNNPDMTERFSKFVSGEDMSILSKPGIVILNYIGTTNYHGFE